MSANSDQIVFHPEAAKRFDQEAIGIRGTVQGLQVIQSGPGDAPDLHPVATISPEDILSGSKFVYEHNAAGDPSGVFWVSGAMRVGWVGEAFQPIKTLVEKMGQLKPIRDLISDEFLLHEICGWLCDSLECRRSDGLADYLTTRINEVVKDHEIWIPLFRTYSSREFGLGPVRFQSISRKIMDEWWTRIPPHVLEDQRNVSALNKRRSELQARLAACIRVRADEKKAVELARAAAQNATALLRFLSPATLNSRLTSYCTPGGTEGVDVCIELFMDKGRIGTMSRGVPDHRNTDWRLDASIELRPGVLENLDRLATDPVSTEYRKSLYDALILYSRQPLAREISDKLVFTLSALESMLLRDSNEPIQKNLGERMAFLIGQSVQQRKDIVKNIDEVYRIRSAFVHHGQTARHVETVDRFLVNAWATMSRLLDFVPRFRTKAALIGALDDQKMS